MRALRFDGRSVILDRSWREPVCAPGEAVVRPTVTGVCSSDTEVARGGGTFCGVMGHEFVGMVEAVNVPEGPDMPQHLRDKKDLVGKRVVGSINVVCGQCDMCRRGLSTHCRHRTVMGVSGRDGVMAERFTIPLANLYPVPSGVDDDHAVFAEPLAAALHAAQMFKAEGKPYITVLGDGKLGLLVVQVMARLNASVRLLGRHPEKFGLCERWGIKHRHVDESGRRQDQDIVVDCTGSAEGLVTAMAMVRPRGTIVLKSPISPVRMPVGAPMPCASSPKWNQPVNLAPLVINEVQLVGSRCGSIPDALAALEKKWVQVTPLVTRRGALDDGPALIDAAQRGNIKVLIDHGRRAA
ncbi:MAG: alcohol dehydrogenase catalytic domain-containing protein [Phycisphaerales bacterium]|nr:alcohol dehydrogenase catalytic domain-containing protein [Phycisphaerales bacterium]